MEPEEVKKYVKRIGFIGSFFALALVFYFLRWRGVLTAYAVFSALILVLAVLIQSGRGGGLAALGGLDADSLLGTRSATPIAKATYVLAALFIFSCMLVARLGLVQASQPSGPPVAPAGWQEESAETGEPGDEGAPPAQQAEGEEAYEP